MKRVLLLLAGYPATGKSTFCARLRERHPQAATIAPDDIKERIWDERGFDDADEKAVLEQDVWALYYEELARAMAAGGLVITDYPFSEKQRPTLAHLVEAHGYHAVTVRFVGDIEAIYQRSLARDLSQGRHLGHLMNHYHKGDRLADRQHADALVTLDVLRDRCISKGYGNFQLGDLVEVDATDIAAVDFDALVDQVERLVAGP